MLELLHIENSFLHVLASGLSASQAQSGGDFVHSAISLYAQGLLGHALTSV